MNTIGWTDKFESGDYEICIDAKGGYGCFEHIFEGEEGGAGGLWFEGCELIDYDGVFALPKSVANGLRDKDFIVDWTCVAGETDPEGETND